MKKTFLFSVLMFSALLFADTYTVNYVESKGGCSEKFKDVTRTFPLGTDVSGFICVHTKDFEAETEEQAVRIFKETYCTNIGAERITCTYKAYHPRSGVYYNVDPIVCEVDNAKLYIKDVKTYKTSVVTDSNNKPVACK